MSPTSLSRPYRRRARIEGADDRIGDSAFEAWWATYRAHGGIPSPRLMSKRVAWDAWQEAKKDVSVLGIQAEGGKASTETRS